MCEPATDHRGALCRCGKQMCQPFVHMLAFDAWIGNSDRHQENWGVLRSSGKASRLAPVFDVASCLGVEFELPGLDDGDPLELKREPQNLHDPHATLFVTTRSATWHASMP